MGKKAADKNQQINKFSCFLERISQLNRLGNKSPIQWYFYTGMLFSSWDKWWGDYGTRATMHEGMDITYYRIDEGKLDNFTEATIIPSFEDGKVLNICDDFLGKTLIIEHPDSDRPSDNTIVYTYAHIVPDKMLKTGDFVQKGYPIATVCNTNRNPKLPPHLHFSCFEISSKIPIQSLSWKLFSKAEENQCIHPLFL